MSLMRSWVDPEEFGRYAWTTLLNLRPTAKWCEIMSLLPHILPCGTCRNGALDWIRTHPLDWNTTVSHTSFRPNNATTDTKSTSLTKCKSSGDEQKKIDWLAQLRLHIQNKNLGKYVSPEVAQKQGHFEIENLTNPAFPFEHRDAKLALTDKAGREILLHDVFVFLITVLKTCGDIHMEEVVRFVRLVTENYGIQLPLFDTYRDESIMEWLIAFPILQSVPWLRLGILGTLACIEFHPFPSDSIKTAL